MIIDVDIFNFINGFAGKWPLLDNIAIFCAVWLGYVLLICLVLFLFSDFRRYWRMVSEALFAALFVRFVLAKAFYLLFFRYRPFVLYEKTHLLLPFNSGMTSFPSGHASFYFALSTIIYGYHKKAGTLFFIGSSLISLSRVFMGIHWPSDILAGAILGILMGLVLNKLFKKIHPLKYVERFTQ